MALRRHEIRFFEDGQVLGDRLPRHVESRTEIPERLPVFPAEPVEEQPPAGVGEGVKDGVVVHREKGNQLVTYLQYRQPNGCASSGPPEAINRPESEGEGKRNARWVAGREGRLVGAIGLE